MTMVPLTAIVALARLGAVDRGWQLFEQAGYVARCDDPAALAVKGRLLKDQAWRAQGVERVALMAQAEQAYAEADAITPAPYLLINVAALATLAGNPARGAAIAGEVLDRLNHEVAETPYYIAATEAEALLLRGDRAGAEAALARAATALPGGWDERAGTLCQLERILFALGEDGAWLDRFRPPASLHYAGHLAIAPDGAHDLKSAIQRTIADRRVGFAFGALAAGTDLLVAETALAAGAELHIVLPCPVDAFARQSVAPYGTAWMARYDACLTAASSVRIVARTDDRFEALATALAAETAMGAALLNARRLAAHAVQLVVVDDAPGQFGGGANTARDAAMWSARGKTDQVVLRWPRDAAAVSLPEKPRLSDHRSLMAVLLIAPGTELSGDDRLDDWIDAIRLQWRDADPLLPLPQHVQPHGNAVLLAFADVSAAARFALAASGWASVRLPTLVAGAYGLARHVEGAIAGSVAAAAEAVLAACPSDTATVDEVFATVLALHVDHRSAIAMGDYDLGRGSGLSLYALIDASHQ